MKGEAEMTAGNEPSRTDATITLATRPARPMRVTATVGDGPQGGNLLAAPGASITWRAEAEGAGYQVTFYELAEGRPIWPFASEPSGTCESGPYLRVTQTGITVTLDRDAPGEIKYEVAAEAGDDVDPLDPVFIIRPPLNV